MSLDKIGTAGDLKSVWVGGMHRNPHDGGHTRVRDVLRGVRPSSSAGFEVRFETLPGWQAQVDYTHFRTLLTGEPSIWRVIWLFSLVLGHSRML